MFPENNSMWKDDRNIKANPKREDDFSYFNPNASRKKEIYKNPTEKSAQDPTAPNYSYSANSETLDAQSIIDQDLRELLMGTGELADKDEEPVRVIISFDSEESLDEFWNKIGGIAGLDTDSVSAGD